MKIAVRNGVFETNSSSTHSLALVRGNASPKKEMKVSFEVCSPLAKVFMLFGFIENAGCCCSGAKGWPRDIVLRFKDAAVKVLAEILGITEEEALCEIECEAFGNRAVKNALGNEAKLREVLRTDIAFAAEFKESKEKDLVKFAEEYYKSDLERFKTMTGGKYRCDSYFYNGCLMECDCGFESYRAMVNKFGLDRYDTEDDLISKARDLLSDDVRILCEELNAGIIPMTTGEKY